jgi:predicted ATPase
MREGIAAISATGAAMGMPYFLCILARACGDAGEAGEGLELIERALGIAESGAKYQLPELLRTKGELMLRLNPRDEAAEGWFKQSLTMAHDEGTKSPELRAALSLARIYVEQGRDEEARDLLVPVYAWFTEGFGTPDLVEAKAVLQTLSHPTVLS